MTETIDLAARVESRLRAEWPGTSIPARAAYIPDEIHEGGATDTFIHLVARIIREEYNPRFIIESDLYRTNDGHDPLPDPVGTFPSQEAAHKWVELQQPLWGEYTVVPLTTPTPTGEPR